LCRHYGHLRMAKTLSLLRTNLFSGLTCFLGRATYLTTLICLELCHAMGFKDSLQITLLSIDHSQLLLRGLNVLSPPLFLKFQLVMLAGHSGKS